MTLTDTGPLVGLLDRSDPNHAACKSAAEKLPPGPILTMWPCFTEAMYLLGRTAGLSAQQALWNLVAKSLLKLGDLSEDNLIRMAELMQKYRDVPMDLADASLIALAEITGERTIYTLDAHFRIYRLKDGGVLNVVS